MRYRYIAFEGPVGVGKSAVATRVAERLDANAVLEEGDNPFLPPFYRGKAGAAFQAELFFLLSRYRLQQELAQRDLFRQLTVSDFLFDRTRLYAYLNLDDSELLIYEKLWSVLGPGLPQPDLVVYLQAPTEVLARRLKARGSEARELSDEYLGELNRAYNHFFFNYTSTPLLVVNTAEVDFVSHDEDVDDLVRQLKGMGKGTQYYVPMPRKR